MGPRLWLPVITNMSAPESIASRASCFRKLAAPRGAFSSSQPTEHSWEWIGDDHEIGIQLGRADGAVDLPRSSGSIVYSFDNRSAWRYGVPKSCPSVGTSSQWLAVQRALDLRGGVDGGRGTCAVIVTCRALSPGRPGASRPGGSDSLVGRNVDANDTSAIRPFGLSKYGRRAREPMRVAGAGVGDAGVVEPMGSFPHSVQAPVHDVVVRAADDGETHRLEIAGNRRQRGVGPVAVPGVRRALERARIEDRRLEVAERHVVP